MADTRHIKWPRPAMVYLYMYVYRRAAGWISTAGVGAPKKVKRRGSERDETGGREMKVFACIAYIQHIYSVRFRLSKI